MYYIEFSKFRFPVMVNNFRLLQPVNESDP